MGGLESPSKDGRRGCALRAGFWQTQQWVGVPGWEARALEQEKAQGLEGQGQQRAGDRPEVQEISLQTCLGGHLTANGVISA